MSGYYIWVIQITLRKSLKILFPTNQWSISELCRYSIYILRIRTFSYGKASYRVWKISNNRFLTDDMEFNPVSVFAKNSIVKEHLYEMLNKMIFFSSLSLRRTSAMLLTISCIFFIRHSSSGEICFATLVRCIREKFYWQKNIQKYFCLGFNWNLILFSRFSYLEKSLPFSCHSIVHKRLVWKIRLKAERSTSSIISVSRISWKHPHQFSAIFNYYSVIQVWFYRANRVICK